MTRILAKLAICALVLAACGRSEPEYLDPVFDKIGNPSCPLKYHWAISRKGETVCTPF